jgi:hypothetical protein
VFLGASGDAALPLDSFTSHPREFAVDLRSLRFAGYGSHCIRCECQRNQDDGAGMDEVYSDADERANSIEAIQELAQATNRPLAEVQEVYEFELAKLKVDARIMDFVPLFASRRTRARLSHHAN